MFLIIRPGPDLTAEISLVPYVREVYYADVMPIPEWNPQYGTDRLRTDLSVVDIKTSYQIEFKERRPIGVLNISWVTSGANYDKSQLLIEGEGN